MKTILLLFFVQFCFSQSFQEKIDLAEQKLANLEAEKTIILTDLEKIKLEKIIYQLKELGAPSKDFIDHSAMLLNYNEEHEQANWVYHMILPDIRFGTKFRTNDFREDPKVKTGTADQEDYFLTDTLSSGVVEYDGYGFDRGHLAPSADFSWSSIAISESFFYSNMSPQLPEFNQKKWAELEGFLRSYVIKENVSLYVVTAPILKDGLKLVPRAGNHLSIPEAYLKFVYDLENDRGIAFIMQNKNLEGELEDYVISINEAEKLGSINVFSNLLETQEETVDLDPWFNESIEGDVAPIDQEKMPRYHFNSIVGGKKIDSKITVCGKVVSSKYTRKGNLWLNLDKSYPNHIFSIFIQKEDLPNFSYNPKLHLENRQVCFNGKVDEFNQVPTIQIEWPKSLYFYDQVRKKN